jgi:hypothetical protein
VGRASFSTESKRYTIMDAPGHKAYVPHMIGGATQADVGVLVISARKGEFEAGLDRGGQTREHVMLAKTAGVRQLVVAINKVDDPTVMYSKDRCGGGSDGGGAGLTDAGTRSAWTSCRRWSSRSATCPRTSCSCPYRA